MHGFEDHRLHDAAWRQRLSGGCTCQWTGTSPRSLPKGYRSVFDVRSAAAMAQARLPPVTEAELESDPARFPAFFPARLRNRYRAPRFRSFEA